MKNLKRTFKKKLPAGVTTFVIIMFGLVSIMYLMGFTNAWDKWQATEEGVTESGGSIENRGVFSFVFEAVTENATLVVGAFGGLVLIGFLTRLTGATYLLTYLAPLGLLVFFANMFIFPIEPMTTHLTFIPQDQIPINVILIAFFNIFLFLTIIEFIRGD